MPAAQAPQQDAAVPGFFGLNHSAAAIQVAGWPGSVGSDPIGRLERLATQAVESGARLLVFPEHVGTMVVASRLGEDWGTLEQAVGNLQAGTVADPERLVVEVFGPMATALGCFICPGSVFVPAGEGAGVMNVSLLISPEGEVILRQAQVHRTAQERALGLTPGSSIEARRTDLATIGIVVGTDAWYPETSRCLALQGATVVACPMAVPAPYGEWRRVAGLWKDVQANQFFGVEACLTGQAFGTCFEGPSSIYATCEMTEGDTGVLARASSSVEEQAVVGSLDFGKLRQTMRRFPIFEHLNPTLYREYFPGLYRRLLAAGLAEASERGFPS